MRSTSNSLQCCFIPSVSSAFCIPQHVLKKDLVMKTPDKINFIRKWYNYCYYLWLLFSKIRSLTIITNFWDWNGILLVGYTPTLIFGFITIAKNVSWVVSLKLKAMPSLCNTYFLQQLLLTVEESIGSFLT